METRDAKLTFVAPVLRVANLARSIAYYRDLLGFDVEFEYENFYAGVVRDGCRVHLKWSTPRSKQCATSETPEHVDACLGVENAAALASALAARGARLAVPLRDMPYGRELYVCDPDGYVLAFIQASQET